VRALTKTTTARVRVRVWRAASSSREDANGF